MALTTFDLRFWHTSVADTVTVTSVNNTTAAGAVAIAVHPNSGDLVQIDLEQAWFWTPEWQALEREADEDFTAGRYETHHSVDDIFNSL